MRKRTKAFVSWSGGKETSLACYRAIKKNFEVKYLLNMVSEDGMYSRSHGISSDLLRAQALSLGIPIVQRKTTWKDYEEEFKKAISDFKKEDIQIGIFGDIDLQEHRDWVERVCGKMGIKPILPLWKEKREKLLKEFIQSGFKAIIVATNSNFLGKEWLGREINEEFVADLKNLSDIDLCGEKGEYHTFVHNGPVFKRVLKIRQGKKVLRDSHWFLNLKLRIKSITCALVFLCSCALIAQSYPQRIISLGPSVTKSLYLLGVEDKLIANTIYCNNPPESKNKEKIGTAVEVNIEKIFNLKPDLVLAISLTSSTAKEKLKNLGLKVVTYTTPRDFNDLCNQFLELGELIGKKREAKKIVKSAKIKVASIKKKIQKLLKPKVLVQVGAKPLIVATGSYFINDFIELAGGINIAKEEKTGLYSREQVVKENPDVIIILTMGIAGEEEQQIWQKYKTINAVKNNRVNIVDADKISSPTPVSFVEVLEELVCILHPKQK
ncbi:MAG: diphthine--ammonia ligase [Elusimicrobiota bacterium]